jgi:hypothetical protein
MERRAAPVRFLSVDRWWRAFGALVLVAAVGVWVSAALASDDSQTPDEATSPEFVGDDAAASARATLAGEVLIGPTCPVVRLDRLDQCQDRPYAATLSIQTSDSTQEVTQVTTDDQGHFSVELDPGTYVIIPLRPPGSILPRGIPQTVTLPPGVVSSVAVHYDSGIR